MPRRPSSRPRQVREPIQVYLDQGDRSLLDLMSERTDAPRSDVIRQALRRFAVDVLSDARPGASLPALIGVLDDAAHVPTDLAAHHDAYLYADAPGTSAPPPKRARKRRKA